MVQALQGPQEHLAQLDRRLGAADRLFSFRLRAALGAALGHFIINDGAKSWGRAQKLRDSYGAASLNLFMREPSMAVRYIVKDP